MLQTDACIVGAGPGGSATALKLSYLGIPSILIDKSSFPRDKTCGDAISGKVTTLLNRLDPAILQRFNAQPIQTDVWGIKFAAPNDRALRIPFKPNFVKEAANAPGYVTKRIDFDNFLIEEVKRRDNIHLITDCEITDFKRSDEGWIVSNKDASIQIATRMLLMSNGAHSSFSRTIAGLEKDMRHHAAAVRAYFKDVKYLDEDNFIELHFIKSIAPGYFWIFPLPNGQANVGLGMRSDILSKRKFNLRKELEALIQQHPVLKERFAEAKMIGDIKGYGLPLGSKKQIISGDHYMLIGDAGHLVDPLTGEGIGNAFYSGFIAAEQLRDCIEQNDFSASFLRAYDKRVDRVLGSEMRLSYRLQQMLQYPFIVNTITYIIGSNKKILEVLSAMYDDFSVREQLAKPLFWIKMFFKNRRSGKLSNK